MSKLWELSLKVRYKIDVRHEENDCKIGLILDTKFPGEIVGAVYVMAQCVTASVKLADALGHCCEDCSLTCPLTTGCCKKVWEPVVAVQSAG